MYKPPPRRRSPLEPQSRGCLIALVLLVLYTATLVFIVWLLGRIHAFP